MWIFESVFMVVRIYKKYSLRMRIYLFGSEGVPPELIDR